MERTLFTFPTEPGELSGWVTGEGPRVLAVHGGPGMNYDYLDDAVLELAARYRVATFQQRGLAPSTLQGEFTVAEAVADIAAVLDGLGWEAAYLVGHSWGGHLVFHAALAIPDRLAGVLSVDPLGAVVVLAALDQHQVLQVGDGLVVHDDHSVAIRLNECAGVCERPRETLVASDVQDGIDRSSSDLFVAPPLVAHICSELS